MPPPGPVVAKEPIAGVKNLIAVASGKGGVGKTTVAVNLAIALKKMGASVGLMDADVYGPNVPVMLGTNEQPRALDERTIIPVEAHGLKMISMGLLSPGDKPLIWRGPMLHSVIQQFLRSVRWGELDYLIVDLPPGTGDVQLTLIQSVVDYGSRGGDDAFDCGAGRRAQGRGNVPSGERGHSGRGGEHELLLVPALQWADRCVRPWRGRADGEIVWRAVSWARSKLIRRFGLAEIRGSRWRRLARTRREALRIHPSGQARVFMLWREMWRHGRQR